MLLCVGLLCEDFFEDYLKEDPVYSGAQINQHPFYTII